MTLSDLAKYSMRRSIARSLCVSWAPCHKLRSSASTVLTATGQVNGRWQFWPPTESQPLRRLPQNFAQLITCARRFWENGWNNVFMPFYLFILSFWDSRTDQTSWWIFMRNSPKDVKSRKDVPFGVWTMCP